MLKHKFCHKYHLNQTHLAGAIIFFLMMNVLSGCVSSSAYDEVSNERDELIKKRNALEGNTKLLRNKIEITEAKTKSLKSELADTQSQLSDTKLQLSDTQSQLSNTRSQLSDVSKSLKEKNDDLNRTSQMLNEKNASLSAASEELAHQQSELLKTENLLAKSNKKLQETTDYIEKTSKLYDELVNGLSSELEANQIKISEMKNGITVNLSQDILFPSGSAALNDSGVNVIKKVSEKLKNIPHQIIVAGFTDNVPIKGELTKMFPTNWELAGARSASVVRLLENQGVDSDKLTAVSFGENQPVASNDDREQRAQNRRIEIRLRPVE